MKEIIEKISSYNLLNYLLPGIVFSFFIEKTTTFSFLPENILVLAFLCYLIGMIISRIGSLIIEPLLKKARFIKFKDYREFVKASKDDVKLDILSEQNNIYRSLIAMILMIGIAKLYEWGISMFPIIKELNLIIILAFLFVLFLYAYKKQSSFIYKRIEEYLK